METQPETYPTEIAHSELLSEQNREIPIEEIFPAKDIESEKVRYWRDLATTRHIALQNCNKGLNRLNRQNRRLKREKDEILLILGEQIEEIRELRKTLMDELKR